MSTKEQVAAEQDKQRKGSLFFFFFFEKGHSKQKKEWKIIDMQKSTQYIENFEKLLEK